MLVRYYVLGVVGAIVFLYLIYIGYTAAKGGKSLLENFRQLLQWRPGTAEPEEDPFQKGMKLFQRNKYREAIPIFEGLAEEARISSQPARFYLLLSGLKENKTGLVARHFDKLDREKFSPDELYRLATSLEASGDSSRAKTLYRYLHDKDPSFRDVAQRLEKA
jgi:TolA-binding protein